MENLKAFIFDFDGTMVDSSGIWREKINPEVFRKYNLPIDIENGFPVEFIGKNSDQIAIIMKDKYKVDISPLEFRKHWISVAYKYIDKISLLKDGLLSFIEYAQKNNIRMAIATNNYKEIVKKCLEINQISKYFEVIVAEDDAENLKPSPDIYNECLKRLGVSANECIVFEDSLIGLVAANKAGIKTISISDNKSSIKEEIKKISYRCIYNYNDILDIFEHRKIG